MSGSAPAAPPRRLSPKRLVLIVAALLSACAIGAVLLRSKSSPPKQEDEPGPVWFEDVTDKVGLHFVHDCGPTDTYLMPQSMGSGAAFLDFDSDGLLDLYLLHHGGPTGKKNQLFKQLPNGTFKDVSDGSSLDIAGFNLGVAIGDVNNDGKPDVLVTQFGSIKFFLNLGGGRFRDATEESGLSNPVWGASAAFLDFDRDGWLDLVVVNYLDYDPKTECKSPHGLKDFCGPNHFSPRSSKLFHNRAGMTPLFEDVSVKSGIGGLPGPGLGVVCADFDGDGWPDIFVANDGKPNRLWINQRDGSFKDQALSRGVAYAMSGQAYAGMGVAIGDVSGSGMFDLVVTHLGSETHTLWRQQPRGLFNDETTASGLLDSRWRGTGFGTVMADFDLNGALDLAIVNGRVIRGGEAKDTRLGFWETYAERNQLFANDGAGKFRDISLANKPFCGHYNVGRGLACGDFDNDGAPDLLVTAIGDRARLFRNVAPNRGNWLTVRATDPRYKRDAYGAEVQVCAGGRCWLRLINPAESYLSSSSPLAHFGLGKVDRIDAIDVKWPDGTRERFTGDEVNRVNRLVELRRGEGTAP